MTIAEKLVKIAENTPNVAGVVKAAQKIESGYVVSLHDVPSFIDELSVKVTGAADPTQITVTQCGKNMCTSGYFYTNPNMGLTNVYNATDDTYTLNGTLKSTGNIPFAEIPYFPDVSGDIYLVLEVISGTYTKVGTGNTLFSLFSMPGQSTFSRVFFSNLAPESKVRFKVNSDNNFTGMCTALPTLQLFDTGSVFNNLKVRIYTDFDNAQGYEPYIEPKTFKPNADGTVKGVKNMNKDMCLYTDPKTMLDVSCFIGDAGSLVETYDELNRKYAELQNYLKGV